MAVSRVEAAGGAAAAAGRDKKLDKNVRRDWCARD